MKNLLLIICAALVSVCATAQVNGNFRRVWLHNAGTADTLNARAGMFWYNPGMNSLRLQINDSTTVTVGADTPGQFWETAGTTTTDDPIITAQDSVTAIASFQGIGPGSFNVVEINKAGLYLTGQNLAEAHIYKNNLINDVPGYASSTLYGFQDQTSITRPNAVYNSFEAQYGVGGSSNMNQFLGFQTRPNITMATPGVINRVDGFWSSIFHTGTCTITENAGFYAMNPIINSGGHITRNFAFEIEDQTTGDTNWGIHSKGAVQSWFNGGVRVSDPGGFIMRFSDTGADAGGMNVDSGTGAVNMYANTTYFPVFWANNGEVARFNTSGQFGIGTNSPTALLHLKAGTASAGTAPIKLTAGSYLTTSEAGTIEFNSEFAFTSTNGGARIHLTQAGVYGDPTWGGTYTGGTGTVSTNSGGNTTLIGGDAYALSGNGNGGNLLLQGGQGHGAGTNGNTTIQGNVNANIYIVNNSGGFIQLVNLPGSCAGAPTGALANVGGVLTICP